MPEIITEARSSLGTVRAHEFPALEAGNLSFPNGRYIVEFEAGSDQISFSVTHRIEGAQLINDSISRGLMTFVCTVASPVSSYRESHISDDTRQIVSWDENDLGEPPLFTPMVVVSKPFKRKLDKMRDGVHELWHGQHVKFEVGMRLAVGDVVQLRSSALHLLLFHEDSSLGNGEFQVKAETQEGFRFRVELASDLHSFLRFGSGDPSRAHILTHIVSACMGFLKSNFSDDDEEDGGWRSYRSLQAFAEYLNSKNLPHWSEGEDFIPELIATKLYPHQLQIMGDGENDS